MLKKAERKYIMLKKIVSNFLFLITFKNKIKNILFSKCSERGLSVSKKYIVRLNKEERQYLESHISQGKGPPYKIKQAQILLNADDNGLERSDKEISFLLRCHRNTVSEVRRRFVEQGLEAALERRKRDACSDIKTKDDEKMIACASSELPEEYPKWYLKIQSGKTVETGIVASESNFRKQWTIPSNQNASFVANMEDVLSLYQRPFNPYVPVICMDEQPLQFIQEKSLPANGEFSQHDYEYNRNGVAELFMFTEPLTGFRRISVRESKKRADWASAIKDLFANDFLFAEKIILICDQYSVHNTAALYEAFPSKQARSLSERIEIHYVPKQGSWLNIAEIELGSFIRQYSEKLISDAETLHSEIKTWESDRKIGYETVEWQLTVEEARTILMKLYPKA